MGIGQLIAWYAQRAQVLRAQFQRVWKQLASKRRRGRLFVELVIPELSQVPLPPRAAAGRPAAAPPLEDASSGSPPPSA